ncbi:helix-turn-helix domain-containing protein [Thermopolyspora sp. NPDC052614]|uniref:helix-turn-helix transcriptional regulator n=1 Tax=Thermopolyspora sp. NPDC052614 TaxID=3155682 RepID=UPI003441883C
MARENRTTERLPLADREFLTIDEARAVLRVPRSTFYRWLSTGRGPKTVRMPNGKRRIKREEWIKWLQDRETD